MGNLSGVGAAVDVAVFGTWRHAKKYVPFHFQMSNNKAGLISQLPLKANRAVSQSRTTSSHHPHPLIDYSFPCWPLTLTLCSNSENLHRSHQLNGLLISQVTKSLSEGKHWVHRSQNMTNYVSSGLPFNLSGSRKSNPSRDKKRP